MKYAMLWVGIVVCVGACSADAQPGSPDRGGATANPDRGGTGGRAGTSAAGGRGGREAGKGGSNETPRAGRSGEAGEASAASSSGGDSGRGGGLAAGGATDGGEAGKAQGGDRGEAGSRASGVGGGNVAGEAGASGAGAGGEGGSSDELGELSGQVGMIDTGMLTSGAPATLSNVLDFGSEPFVADTLSLDAQRVLETGVGSSGNAEAIAFEVLRRGEGASLVKTGDEVEYTSAGKTIDFLVDIQTARVGVSVTRALSSPPGADLSLSDAGTLLQKKLDDLLVAAALVAPEDAWSKAILVVLAYDTQKVAILLEAYALLDAETKSNTILMLTLTDGDDAFIY